MLFKSKKVDNNILNKINKKDRLEKYIFLIIGCFLTAFTFNVFFSPNNLVIGGISGISIIIKNIFGFPTEIFIVISYLILIILSYLVLGKKSTKYSIMGSILYPVFVYITKDMANLIQFDVNNMFLITVFGALINGIGTGVTFKYGFSTGGTDIIFQIMSKYFKISIGNSMKIFNTIIILSAGFFVGNGEMYAWENVMYAIIAVYIVTVLTDKLLLGISSSKAFYVITEHETSIKKFLLNEIGKGVTVLDGHGGYTGDVKKIIMCVIPTKQYFLAKEGILEIDKEAIILINDVYQSTGIE